MRYGRLDRLPCDRDGNPQHTVRNVFTEMLWQVVRDYGSLPDYRTLTMDDIAFWYTGLHAELMRASKPR